MLSLPCIYRDQLTIAIVCLGFVVALILFLIAISVYCRRREPQAINLDRQSPSPETSMTHVCVIKDHKPSVDERKPLLEPDNTTSTNTESKINSPSSSTNINDSPETDDLSEIDFESHIRHTTFPTPTSSPSPSQINIYLQAFTGNPDIIAIPSKPTISSDDDISERSVY